MAHNAGKLASSTKSLISVIEAQEKIISSTTHALTEAVPLLETAGRVLAEDICADRPFPPFHRVAMDGFAIWVDEVEKNPTTYRVQEVQAAGSPPAQLLDRSFCIEVMTGAVLPGGTNCIIPYEEVVRHRGENETEAAIVLKDVGKRWMPMSNIHREGCDAAFLSRLVKKGSRIDCHVVGIAAAVGKSQLRCTQRPRIAIVSTGSELVSVESQPLPHQIRSSNAQSIAAALARHGYSQTRLYHVRDDGQKLLETIGELTANNDFILFTGGVSVGKYDLVPSALEAGGVRQIFHGIAQKPGKPLWFGRSEADCLVFGLPGNPMSALVCLHRFAIPAINLFSGITQSFQPSFDVLYQPGYERKNQVLFAPATFHVDGSGFLRATLKKHHGSGDFVALLDTDGFVEIPPAGESAQSWQAWLWEPRFSPFIDKQKSSVGAGGHAANDI